MEEWENQYVPDDEMENDWETELIRRGGGGAYIETNSSYSHHSSNSVHYTVKQQKQFKSMNMSYKSNDLPECTLDDFKKQIAIKQLKLNELVKEQEKENQLNEIEEKLVYTEIDKTNETLNDLNKKLNFFQDIQKKLKEFLPYLTEKSIHIETYYKKYIEILKKYENDFKKDCIIYVKDNNHFITMTLENIKKLKINLMNHIEINELFDMKENNIFFNHIQNVQFDYIKFDIESKINQLIIESIQLFHDSNHENPEIIDVCELFLKWKQLYPQLFIDTFCSESMTKLLSFYIIHDFLLNKLGNNEECKNVNQENIELEYFPSLKNIQKSLIGTELENVFENVYDSIFIEKLKEILEVGCYYFFCMKDFPLILKTIYYVRCTKNKSNAIDILDLLEEKIMELNNLILNSEIN